MSLRAALGDAIALRPPRLGLHNSPSLTPTLISNLSLKLEFLAALKT
jgi:hypothetical protein